MPAPRDRLPPIAPAKCAACHGPMESPAFCDHCRSLYPADGVNYFELLGFEPTYDLDTAVLRKKYLHVSRGVHPDRHGDSGSSLSLRLSAQLNEAHRVLADPVFRAEYLLELVGGKSATQDRTVPREVLSTTFALREEIQEAKAASDDDALADCATRVRQVRDSTLSSIADLARRLPGDDNVRGELRAKLNTAKYYQRLLSEL